MTPPYMNVKLAEARCEVEMRLFDEGDKGALLRAVLVCAEAGIPLPRRCAEAFVRAVDETMLGAHSTWDVAFGRPHGKNKKARAVMLERQWRQRIYTAVVNVRSGLTPERVKLIRQQGPAGDTKLVVQLKKPPKMTLKAAFARVYEMFKGQDITEPLVKKYYYAAIKAEKTPRGKTLATVTLMANGEVVTDFAK